MSSPENAAPDPGETAEDVSAPRTNPHLTANLQADYDAIRNDLEQAKVLAADFQKLAADKSNELAHIKGLLEKTSTDLNRLQSHVNELRQERHRLANELMIASGTEVELTKVKRERDQLKAELENFRQAALAQIANLQGEMVQQRAEISSYEAATRVSTAAALEPLREYTDEAAAKKIRDLTATVNRLMAIVEGRRAIAVARQEEEEAEEEFISISYETVDT